MDIVIIPKISFKKLFQIIKLKKNSCWLLSRFQQKQKDDLDRQIEAVKNYISKYSEEFEITQDIRLGINYNKQGLKNHYN